MNHCQRIKDHDWNYTGLINYGESVANYERSAIFAPGSECDGTIDPRDLVWQCL